jgi:hypothetical protein
MTMTHQPLPLSHDWAERVAMHGSVGLGTYTQPQLLAAGIDLAASHAEGRDLKSSFEQLDTDSQRRAIDAAAAQPIDPSVHSVLAGVATDPLVRGSWHNTPAWFKPLTASFTSTLLGAALPDGSLASLEAAIDLVTSEVSVTVRTLPDQARELAAQYFGDDPPLPADTAADAGWTDESGGGLAMLTLVWPHGRGTRAVTWRITRTSGESETAFLQTRRDHGMKRSVDESVTKAGFTQRLQDVLEQAWSQAR